MIPPKAALHIYEAGAGERERSVENARRDRLRSQYPPKPHGSSCVTCELCRKWARDIFDAPAPAAGGGT